MVCSEHFAEECFERSLHVGSQQTLRPGSIPSIWMSQDSQAKEPSTSRSVQTRKKVKHMLLVVSIYFMYSFTFQSVVFLIFKCNLIVILQVEGTVNLE